MRASFLKPPLLALGLALGLALSHAPVWAAQPGDMPVLKGQTLAGQPFSLAALRGRVTLVVFWSTGCAVCYSKMPELRANAQGWRGKPFELITVSLDRKRQDTADYEKLVLAVVSKDEHLLSLWAGDPAYQSSIAPPARLPAAYLIDKSGRVVEQYSGRIPPEAWDRIADLL